MRHTIAIISNLKEKNQDGKYLSRVDSRFSVSQEEVEQFILDEYLRDNPRVTTERDYKAEIEETTF